MAKPKGSLQRSLAGLTIGMAQGQAARRRALVDTLTGEYIQQVHVPVSGNASVTPGSVDTKVQWEMPFLYAPLQRRVPYPTPHFNYGVEMTAGLGELVRIHAQVIGWTVTDAQWYVGAAVRFIVDAPNATSESSFAAIAHLSFQGFATMAETDEFA